MAIRTALVVDDSRLARLTLTKLLEKRDIQVTQASSAREAMESLVGARPDVIMMDVTMPDTDGFEATRQITGNPDTQSIPVVMCTAEDTNEARDRAHACGAHGFLTKPASEENITDVLHRLAEQLEASEPALEEEIAPAVPLAVTPARGQRRAGFACPRCGGIGAEGAWRRDVLRAHGRDCPQSLRVDGAGERFPTRHRSPG